MDGQPASRQNSMEASATAICIARRGLSIKFMPCGECSTGINPFRSTAPATRRTTGIFNRPPTMRSRRLALISTCVQPISAQRAISISAPSISPGLIDVRFKPQPAIVVTSLFLKGWVKSGPPPVAENRHRQGDQENGEPGDNGKPPRVYQVVPALTQHLTE